MAQYLIREENMERLEKKLASLEKKCKASHCSFSYEVTGTEFHKAVADDGTEHIAKYFRVEVEGAAKYNGWKFVATLDHHAEGNVVRAFDTELTIPEKYKTCGPTCEHCNKIRSRKDTYLIFNEETKEFKQVGKSCLQEFTNGLRAEDIAFLCSIYEKFEAGYGFSGPSYNRYIEVEGIVRYAFECYKNWGFQKSASSFYEEEVPVGYRSTRDRVVDYYYVNRAFGEYRKRLYEEMDSVGFNADSEYAVSNTKSALEWIRNIDKDEMDKSEYLRNLHVICSDEYTDWRSLGILVSLTVSYMRHIDKVAAYEKKQKEQKKEIAASEYVGTVGQKLVVNCKTFDIISSWQNMYGMTYLYKFTDDNGNVFIWYASKPITEDRDIISVNGTVKDHSEYNGLKQTVMTRCKVSFA